MHPLVGEGVTLMLYGMSTVVLFLLLLVAAMRVLAWFVSLRADPAVAPAGTRSPMQGTEPDEHIIAAIAAAVKRFRDRAQ